MKAIKLISCFAIAMSLALVTMTGCTKKPNKDDVAKLEEAKNAAENSQKKLYDLKQERMKLETEKEKNQGDQKKGEDK